VFYTFISRDCLSVDRLFISWQTVYQLTYRLSVDIVYQLTDCLSVDRFLSVKRLFICWRLFISWQTVFQLTGCLSLDRLFFSWQAVYQLTGCLSVDRLSSRLRHLLIQNPVGDADHLKWWGGCFTRYVFSKGPCQKQTFKFDIPIIIKYAIRSLKLNGTHQFIIWVKFHLLF
jgi:hypothetical protein